MDVGKGGAAEAGLKAGDRVMMIEGKTPDAFSKKTDTGLEGPQALLGNSLDRKSSSSNPVLSLRVRRESGQLNLSVDLPKSPSFSFSRPLACRKRKNYLAEIARHLVEVQEKNGRWKPGVGGDADVYTTAFCGLVLLANNDPAHLPSVKRGIEFVKRASIDSINPDDPKVGPKNWQTAANGIFLAEYQLATGDKRTSKT